jgi:hypothetical protein
MSEREQPGPGEGWRLASGDDYQDERCQYWNDCMKQWMPRPLYTVGCTFGDDNFYRIPDRTPQPDLVNAPPHYRQGDIECIDAIRSALTDEEFRGYVKGNAMKYLWREKHKGGDEDLKKAAWYLSRIETKESSK